MWFKKLTGFAEESPDQVRKNIKINGQSLQSLVNGQSYYFGKLEISSLAELRKKAPSVTGFNNKISVSEVVGDVQLFHVFPENENALFQAASQFNLLEMVSPRVTPEDGIGRYQYDKTQGPACAIACGAGTIYRNYFAEINDKIGQTADNQIDCLAAIGKELNNDELNLWQMKNGYALATKDGLEYISKYLKSLNQEAYENLKSKLKIGIQWNTEVTLSETKHRVSQIYCSALPVSYSQNNADEWDAFARLILEATYEATLYAALINYKKTGNNKLFLTLVGGGAFGNKSSWILDAIKKAITLFKNTPLDVKFVSYGGSDPVVKNLIVSLDKY